MTVNRPEPDHDTLLKLYGKAMLRISQLAHATHQLRRHGNGRVLEDTPELTEQGLQDLVVKVDALRALIFESNGGLSKPRSYPPRAQVGADKGQSTNDHAHLTACPGPSCPEKEESR